MQTDVEPPTQTLKRTALYPVHAELGARFGPFAGWELPLYYSSILQEHEAVRKRAGLFDVSHLGHLEISGPTAASHLQLLVTQDLTELDPGRACYTPMLTSRGTILDEMIIYRLEPERFRLVVNAANGEKVLAWLKSRLGSGIEVADLREKFGTLAFQGPRALEILAGLCSTDPAQFPRYSVQPISVIGKSGWIARTGYTGEDGAEIFLQTQDLEPVWRAILQAGKETGAEPVGLGARDTLRLEAGLPLGGSDLDERTTPLEAGLGWTVQWRKGPFVGRDALEQQRRKGTSRLLVGFELREPGVPRPGYPIFRGEEKIGQVTSGTMLAGNRAIGLGYLPPAVARPGTEIQIEIHQRKVKAEIVKLPFYRRAK